MKHKETIKKIQELVPDVMKLGLGCKIKSLKDVQGSGTIVLDGDVGNYVGGDNFLFEDAKMFGVSRAGFEWERGVKNQYVSLKNYGNLNSEFEILGKPITLAIALYAVLLHKHPDSEEDGLRFNSDIISLTRGHFGFKGWDLSKDDFNEQSEDTKDFIGELLK